MTTWHVPPERQPKATGLGPELEALHARLQLLRTHDPDRAGEADPHLEIVQDLETAYEELRVADEEIRGQQDQISELLDRHNELHWRHERVFAMLPVAAIVTDPDGIIRTVNPAAASLVDMRVDRLLGTPVFSLFTSDHRRELRELVIRRDPSSVSRPAVVVSRAGEPVPVDVSVSRGPGEDAELTWLLLAPGSPRGHHLAAIRRALSELAGLPAREADPQAVLHGAAGICQDTLAGAEVSINLGAPDHPDAVASTSRRAQALDGAQLAAGEGPCLAAFATRRTVSSQDLSADGRWPTLAHGLPSEVVGVVAVPIEVGERPAGTLTMYDFAGPFDATVEDAAELLAATLGAVFYEMELNAELDRLGEDMHRALSSRATIEQAKGIVMSLRRCGPDEAFAHLAELSSRQERKLREVAQDIVARASSG